MATGLIDVIKRASLEAMYNSQICDLRIGTVTSINPLNVSVTPIFSLKEPMLIVPQRLTDYEIEVTTDGYGWETTLEAEHTHEIEQTKRKIKVHGALKVGDKVALLRKQGGQSYFILDKLPNE